MNRAASVSERGRVKAHVTQFPRTYARGLVRCGIALLAIGLLAGCAIRSRVILVDTPAAARKAADLTAREWGFRFLQLSNGRVIYRSAQLSGPSNEQLRLSLDPIERGEVRATAKFTGPTGGAERFFLSDLQKNISTGTILPVVPGP